MKKILTLILTIMTAISISTPAGAIVEYGNLVRLKDITHVKGVRDNQVVGYGIVVGLQNTGDNSRHTQMTAQQMLQNLGTVVDQANYIQKGAAAAVIVTVVPESEYFTALLRRLLRACSARTGWTNMEIWEKSPHSMVMFFSAAISDTLETDTAISSSAIMCSFSSLI